MVMSGKRKGKKKNPDLLNEEKLIQGLGGEMFMKCLAQAWY